MVAIRERPRPSPRIAHPLAAVDAAHARKVGAGQDEGRASDATLVPHGAAHDRPNTAAIAIRCANREGGFRIMKELLRVSMSARHVREACEEWARAKCQLPVDGTTCSVEFNAEPSAVVIFTKKRVRNSTKEKA